ncbi:MAG: hypothetical protein ACRC1T_02215 [Clostridium chrysemydis]|uniref:hypothetical protein n=1 Tax=Clostridium chrysemydis TaxID=2665504 RepID=UPI003F405144
MLVRFNYCLFSGGKTEIFTSVPFWDGSFLFIKEMVLWKLIGGAIYKENILRGEVYYEKNFNRR